MSKRRSRPILGPPVNMDKFVTIKMACDVCGHDTGKERSFRRSQYDPERLFGDQPEADWRLRDGLCPKCEAELAGGHILIFTDRAYLSIDGKMRKHLDPRLRDETRPIKVSVEAFKKTCLQLGKKIPEGL